MSTLERHQVVCV